MTTVDQLGATHRPPVVAPTADADGTGLDGSCLVLGFGKHVVVDGATLRLRPGRVTALVGPNGSGKTTLLRALARLHRRPAARCGLGLPARGSRPQCPASRALPSPRAGP